jgi:hypothetical protein
VPFIHCERVFHTWAKDARSKCLSKVCDITFIGRREVDESCEMRCDGIEGSNIIQAKLAKRGLKNFDPWCRVWSFS